jgi:hypothetical protein
MADGYLKFVWRGLFLWLALGMSLSISITVTAVVGNLVVDCIQVVKDGTPIEIVP